MASESKQRIAVPIAELAAEIGVGHRQVVEWIKAGLLPAFVPPGKDLLSKKCGRKGLRVWRDDWDLFCRAQTKVQKPAAELENQPASAPLPVTRRPGGVAVGPDGISRLRGGGRRAR